MQRHQTPQRHRLIVGRPKIHSCGDYSDIVELHPGGEGPGSAADVEAEAENRIGGLGDLEELGDGEVQLGLVSHEIGEFMIWVETGIGVLAVEAAEAFAGVFVP